jgi:predicted dehydrogenase
LGSTAPPLLAVYSRSQSSSQQLAENATQSLGLKETPAVYHDGDDTRNLSALLQRRDIAAVIIVLPITTQPDVITAALQAGKHVLSEKPVAKDVASGLEHIVKYRSTYQPQGLIWRVAENFEAEDVFRTAASLISSGKLGKVQTFKATVLNYVDKNSKWYQTSWRTIPDVSSPLLTFVR